MLPQQEAALSHSRVVHATVDPTILTADKKRAVEEEEGAEEDPDLVITSARRATVEDGLLENHELVDLFRTSPPLRSVYDEWASTDAKVTFGSRVNIPPPRRGQFEPIYTSYTHYWKSVLGDPLKSWPSRSQLMLSQIIFSS